MLDPLAATPNRNLRGWSCLDNDRHEVRRRVLGVRYRMPGLPTPSEYLLWGEPMPARNVRNHRAHCQRLFDDAGLEISRKPTPAARSRNYF
jgi:hypothetical protein